MASSWSGVFNVVEEAKRHTDNFVTMRCVDNGRKDESTFFKAMFWGKPGEWVEKCRPGESVFLSGRPQLEEYNGKNYLNLQVREVQFLPKGKSEGKAVTKKVNTEVVDEPVDVLEEELGEDIPF